MKIISAVIILLYYIPVRSSHAQSVIEDVQTIEYLCTADSSYQKALYYVPDIDEPAPLLVALHSWSSDYTNPNYVNYADYCINNNWVFIHPDFRGKNDNPDATGSSKALQDIVDAVRFAEGNSLIDTSRIYLAGASGGGHAALLTAGKYPQIWAGVSAWVPITDLVQWYTETKERDLKYWQDIYNSCGGDPTTDTAAYNEAWKRSPINFLDNAKDVPFDINAGINDGHDNFSVPVSHSLNAFNILAGANDNLTQEEIDYFVANAEVPPSLSDESENDPLYENKQVLFRRKSDNVRITIFEGGHEIIYSAACEWLSHQAKNNTTGVTNRGRPSVPQTILLKQNYPNPFSAGGAMPAGRQGYTYGGNPYTTIEYILPSIEQSRIDQIQSFSIQNTFSVSLKVYDILGRVVATLVNEQQRPGEYEVVLEASRLTSGTYFYTLTTDNFVRTKKMILLK
jgi:pimeloyl-ACP methyl ester carboxylesterase